MRLYGKYLRKYKWAFFFAIFCVACETVCDLMGPTLMARIINQGVEQNAPDQVLHWGFYMLLVTAVGAIFAVTRNIIASNVSQRMGADLRYDLFRKVMHFSEQSADKLESGSLITRLTNDSSQVVMFANGMMRIFFKAPVMCLGSIVLASILNFRMSLVVYAAVILVTTCIAVSMKLSYPRFAKLQKAMDRVNAIVQEYLIGVRLVKAFGTYDAEEERFGAANQTLMQRGISAQMVITFIAPLLNLTVGFGTVLIIWIGSRLFSVQMVGTGDVSAFTIYMTQILTSLLIITNIFNVFVRTKASTARVLEVLDSEEEVAGGETVDGIRGDITFDHVTFAYPTGSGVPVLKDLSFSTKAGESLAIIGPTGSGKSTIAWLLLRFYDVTDGTIRLDGRDIREMTVDTVRQNVALVPQKPMLFSGTVADNIRWGKTDAAEAEIAAVARKAQAGFIAQMPHGYDSQLGSGGVNVSGGQKQRISLARGLLKQAPILILDDATSALDSITEAKVRAQLLREDAGHAVIFITQRCTTAMFADRILVLEDGRRVGFGKHQELMENCEVYREIYHSQIETQKEG